MHQARIQAHRPPDAEVLSEFCTLKLPEDYLLFSACSGLLQRQPKKNTRPPIPCSTAADNDVNPCKLGKHAICVRTGPCQHSGSYHAFPPALEAAYVNTSNAQGLRLYS